MTTTHAIYECSRGHQTAIEVTDSTVKVTIRCTHKGCSETAYYQPATTKPIYETGATSHAVNDLILFTDNTRELAAERDKIYSRWATFGGIPIAHDWTLSDEFYMLLEIAVTRYRHEFPDSATHVDIYRNRYKTAEAKEYCILYANDFDNWKLENNIK